MYDRPSGNLDVKKGFVGGQMVNVLRDTGCEAAAVARVWVDTPYCVGDVEAMVLKSLYKSDDFVDLVMCARRPFQRAELGKFH